MGIHIVKKLTMPFFSHCAERKYIRLLYHICKFLSRLAEK